MAVIAKVPKWSELKRLWPISQTVGPTEIETGIRFGTPAAINLPPAYKEAIDALIAETENKAKLVKQISALRQELEIVNTQRFAFLEAKMAQSEKNRSSGKQGGRGNQK